MTLPEEQGLWKVPMAGDVYVLVSTIYSIWYNACGDRGSSSRGGGGMISCKCGMAVGVSVV